MMQKINADCSFFRLNTSIASIVSINILIETSSYRASFVPRLQKHGVFAEVQVQIIDSINIFLQDKKKSARASFLLTDLFGAVTILA